MPLPAPPAKNQQVELEATIQNRQQQLERIQSELQEKKETVKGLESQEKQHLNKLYALDEQLNLNSRLITKITNQITDITELIDKLGNQLELSSQDLEYHQDILSQRLVWIYKRSRISPLASALSADSPLQAARRLYMFSILNQYDRNLVDEIESLIAQTKSETAELEKRKTEITTLMEEKQRQTEIISVDRGARKKLLDQVRTQKDVEQKAIDQLDEDQSRIAAILETLFEDRKILDKEAAAEFENLKGKLLWPVFGEVLRKFGKIKNAKYNTVVNSPGIDIKAEAGTDVVASSSGEVAYISWLRGYGSFIILDHGGGYYSLYSHLDDILVETGLFITAGEAIATVGETGTLTGPMLHFELRYGKEQLDPLPWLR